MTMEHKEYDLIDIIKFFWNLGVSYIWNPLVFLLRFCLQRWYAFLLAIVFGVGVAFFCAPKSSTTYTSNMVVYYTADSEDDVLRVIDELCDLSASERMEQMQLSEQVAQDWLSVAADAINVDERRMSIVVNSKSEASNRAMQLAVIAYLNGNAMLQQQHQFRHAVVQKSIVALQKQCEMIEALPSDERADVMSSYLSSASEIIKHERMLARETAPVVLKRVSLVANQPMSWMAASKRYVAAVVAVVLVVMLVFHFRKEIYSFIYPDKK